MLENSDDGYTGTSSHPHVFRRVPYVDAGAGLEAKPSNGQLKLQRMWLATRNLVAADAHGKKGLQPECANLRANAPAAAAAD